MKQVRRLYEERRANRTPASYKGLLSHCDSYQLGRTIFGEYSEDEWTEGWFVLQRDSDKIKAANNGKHSE